MRMSPLRPPNGPHRNLKILRPLQKVERGMKLEDCTFLELYKGITGRISTLSTDEDNRLEEIYGHGEDIKGLRKVLLTPNYPLYQMLVGDYLVVPWGVRPNTWIPHGLPQGTGYYIWINTPSDPQRLVWNGVGFIGTTINIEKVDDQWCLTGEVEHCFVGDSFCSEEFPEGYSFLRISGPPAYLKIVAIDEQIDHLGRISFYSIETVDPKNTKWYTQ
jgi:hypothetical protein